MSILNRSFRYRDANETSKPGYLKRRFAEIRRMQEREKEHRALADAQAAAKIKPIKAKS